MKNRTEKFYSLYRLSVQKSITVRWVITVLLSAFAFMLFALGTSAFTYNETNYLTRAYFNYIKDRQYVEFAAVHGGSMSLSDVRRVEEATGVPFVYYSYGVLWYNLFGREESEYFDDLYDISNQSGGFAGELGLAGFEEDYKSMGYSLLAGRFPTEKNEVAISEAQYEVFYNRGFPLADSSERVSVQTYTDVIGKTVQTSGGSGEYTIVGVANTNFDRELASAIGYIDYPAGRWMFSGDFKTADDSVYRIFAHVANNYKTVKKCVKIMLEFEETVQENAAGTETASYPVLRDIQEVRPVVIEEANGMTDVDVLALILGGAGVFFGIFAVLLNGYLTTVSIERKQKEIGILRSMGADERTVKKIFLFESVLTATAIFLCTVILSVTVYYSVIQTLLSYQSFGISPFVYNGWTVLISAVVCYAVPLLCTIAPLKKFFQKPIIDNITGNTMKKRK